MYNWRYIFFKLVFSTEVTAPELPSNNVMPNHEAYHGNISPNECKRKLKARGTTCFLFRYSNSRKVYQLALVDFNHDVKFLNLKVDREKPSFGIVGSEKGFETVESLINYYQRNPISPTIQQLGEPCNAVSNEGLCNIF